MKARRVVIVGGGWGGCAAAIASSKAGGDVVLVEYSDRLLGTGLTGGIFRNNGRHTAAEELVALGAGELIAAADRAARHGNVSFPGHRHATLIDVGAIEALVRTALYEANVRIMRGRAIDVRTSKGRLLEVIDNHGHRLEGDAFVDATGSSGPMQNCLIHGKGCSMCALRCSTYGGRRSLTSMAGAQEICVMRKEGGRGAMSGACTLHKSSLSTEFQRQLDDTGVVIVPLPVTLSNHGDESLGQHELSLGERAGAALAGELRGARGYRAIGRGMLRALRTAIRPLSREVKSDKLALKVCRQYALPEYANNLILLDTGDVKLMSPFFDLDTLRTIPGFERAMYSIPLSAGLTNSMRFFDVAKPNTHLQIPDIENLFVCGEKAALCGHTEAILSGTLAGHNAANLAFGRPLFEFPDSLACGDLISFVCDELRGGTIQSSYSLSGAVYFERMQALGLYSTDRCDIRARVADAGLLHIFSGQEATKRSCTSQPSVALQEAI